MTFWIMHFEAGNHPLLLTARFSKFPPFNFQYSSFIFASFMPLINCLKFTLSYPLTIQLERMTLQLEPLQFRLSIKDYKKASSIEITSF